MFKTLRFVTIAALVALPSTLAGNPAGGGGINGNGVSTGGGGGGGANGTGASGTTSTGGVTGTSGGGGTSGSGVNGTNSTTGGTSARQCPLVLSSTSTDQWQIGCTEGFQASSGAITFDASKFQLVRVSSDATVTTLKPETKPTELIVPKSFAKVDALASSSITSFSFEGVNGSTVEFNTACFTKMTTLRKVSVTSTAVTINGPLELPPSLNEITFQRTGLVDFKVKIDKNATYNITKIDLGYNRVRYIPLVILASPTLVSANLEGNDLAPLRLSTRKLRRFAYLVVTKRLIVGSIADFNQTCTDGETKSVKVGARTVAVCQIPKDEDDDLVADSDESADAVGDSVSSSIITQTNTTTTTTISSDGTVTVKNTTTVTTQKPGDVATKTNAASMRSWSFGIACLGLVASLVL